MVQVLVVKQIDGYVSNSTKTIQGKFRNHLLFAKCVQTINGKYLDYGQKPKMYIQHQFQSHTTRRLLHYSLSNQHLTIFKNPLSSFKLDVEEHYCLLSTSRPFLIKIVNHLLTKSLKNESAILLCLHKPHTHAQREIGRASCRERVSR